MSLERAGEHLFRATVADDMVLLLDREALQTLPQGQAQLGRLLAQEMMQARKRNRGAARSSSEHHEDRGVA